MFNPLEALPSHTHSKSYYPIHELFPTNLLSFQEPVNFGTPYLPLPFLNPTTYLPSNLTSTNRISFPYLINFPFFFFLYQGFVIASISLSLTLHTKKNRKSIIQSYSNLQAPTSNHLSARMSHVGYFPSPGGSLNYTGLTCNGPMRLLNLMTCFGASPDQISKFCIAQLKICLIRAQFLLFNPNSR